MKGRGCMVWMLSILVALAVLVAWTLYADRRNSTYYKMTVEVETPEGVRSGHSVREVHYGSSEGWSWLPLWWLGEQRPQWRLRGEAVAVDIAPGQTLFALLSNGSGQADYAGRDIWQMLKDNPEQSGGTLELWPGMSATRDLKTEDKSGSIMPMLVTFSDPADPNSVRKVEPDSLNTVFGSGVKLVRITVQAVDEPITTGMHRRLGWLNNYYAKRLDGQRFGDGSNLANDLSAGAFSTESNK